MAREAGASVLLLESAPRGLARRQFAAHPQHPLHARRAAGRAGRRLSRRGVLAGPAQGHRRPDRRDAGAHGDPRVVDLPRLDAPPRRALPAAAVRRAARGANQCLLHGRRQGARQRLLPQRRGARRSHPLRRAGRCASSSPTRRFVAARIGKRADRGARLRARRRRLRVEPRMAERGLGNERARRAAGGELPHPRHAASTRACCSSSCSTAGADRVGDPTQAHMVAIDARAPLYDGGICTRIDCVSLGVVVNRDGERFYDEGEDFWPKRYAIWGRLVALQPGQIAYSIIDSKAIGRFMPPVFAGHARGLAGRAGARACACRRPPSSRPLDALQRGLPRRARSTTPSLDDCAHRGPGARQDALGAADRHAAVLRLCAPAGRDLHVPRPQGERARALCTSAACRARTCSWPAR